MTIENLARLSRTLGSAISKETGESVVWHDRVDKVAKKLDPVRREQLIELTSHIRAAIPTDFAFWVQFKTGGIEVFTEFEDGNTGGSAESFFFTSGKSMCRKLRATPWDEIRTELMQQASIFDELQRAADDRPPNIPRSEEAAAIWVKELREVAEKLQSIRPPPAFALVIARNDLGVYVEDFATRDEVVFTIADRMTTQNDILAVFERGIPWAYAEIESAKLEAVEQLGPISKAKAERRYF